MATQHIIIGGGPVAINAVETIREFDAAAQVTLISDERAHSRMALPYWLSGQVPREHTYTADDASLKQLNVDARIGQRVESIDPDGSTVTLDDGSTLAFDNLLIATGSSPSELQIPGTDLSGVQNLWTLDHTQSLLDTIDGKERPKVVMIGAGFNACIMVNAMYKRGWQLAVIARGQMPSARVIDEGGAALVEPWLREKGVELHCGATVPSITDAGDGTKVVELDNGTTITADAVVMLVGVKANTDLVHGSGIEMDQGILVNDRMQTNFANIYAGGDVAQGPALYSDKPEVHAIHPTAVDHGRIAGANMAGHEVHYPGSLSMNVLDNCGLQTFCFGNWNDAEAETMTISNPGGYIYRKLLWRADQLVGAVLVGPANDMGMLTDVGMVKGILQTQTRLGQWKQFLAENPFDIRRAYIGAGVAQKLIGMTLTGQASRPRGFRFDGKIPTAKVSDAHATFMGPK